MLRFWESGKIFRQETSYILNSQLNTFTQPYTVAFINCIDNAEFLIMAARHFCCSGY
jgi:hypothetical protein